MADSKHLDLLHQGMTTWNAWRRENDVAPDLSQADLGHADLRQFNLRNARLWEANLRNANLSNANLNGAVLSRADLTEADLSDTYLSDASLNDAILDRATLTRTLATKTDFSNARMSNTELSDAILNESRLSGATLNNAELTRTRLIGAVFFGAELRKANLQQASLIGAFLTGVDLSNANLVGADLTNAHLSLTNLTGANLTGAELFSAICDRTNFTNANIENARIYGVSTWDIKTEGLQQRNLIITRGDESGITVDNIDVAQFVYLLLNREKLRDVINTVTSKTVLILGRFTPERKVVLDAIADELRRYDLIPIIFNFERAQSRDFTETIKTLAGISAFVIVDITNPSSAPLELQAIVPDYQIPFISIIQQGEEPFAMFKNLSGKYYWIFEPIEYDSVDILLQGFQQIFIDRAADMKREIDQKKSDTKVKVQTARDFLNAGKGNLEV